MLFTEISIPMKRSRRFDQLPTSIGQQVEEPMMMSLQPDTFISHSNSDPLMVIKLDPQSNFFISFVGNSAHLFVLAYIIYLHRIMEFQYTHCKWCFIYFLLMKGISEIIFYSSCCKSSVIFPYFLICRVPSQLELTMSVYLA